MQGIRRGFLKYYVLKLLKESSFTGYGLMKKIEEETGFWEPSPGSLYPLLDSLQDSGLIKGTEEGDGTQWSITEKGARAINEAQAEKTELFQSMKRSMIVFSNVFGESGIRELAESMSEWRDQSEGRSIIRSKLMNLQRIVCDLPELDREEEERITKVIDKAIDKISEITGGLDEDEKGNRSPRSG